MSLLEGGLTALESYRTVQDQKIRREQAAQALKIERERQDILNYEFDKTQRNDLARDMVGEIHNHFGGDTVMDYRTQPWERLNEENPELAAKLANAKPGYVKFLNEKGENVQGKIVRFDKIKNKDGDMVYVPMVQRFDTGEVRPMTEGRTANPEDPVVEYSPEKFKSQMDRVWRIQVQNGGMENDITNFQIRTQAMDARKQKLLRDQNISTALTDGILDVVEADGSVTPEAKSQFFSLILDIEDPEELKKVAEKQGIDVDALIEKGQVATDREIMATAPEDSLERILYENGVTREVWTNADDEQRKVILERLNSKRNWNAAVEGSFGTLAAAAEDLATAPWDLLVNGYNKLSDSKLGRKLGMSELIDEPTPMRSLTTAMDENLATERRGYERRGVEDIDDVFANMFEFELTPENISAAIKNNPNPPTKEQAEAVSDFLDSKGIRTEEGLRKAINAGEIADNDAMAIALLAGMAADGTTQDKDKTSQTIMNFIAGRDFETTKYQQAAMDDAEKARATAQYIAETDREKLLLEARQYDDGQQKDATEAAAGLLERVSEIYDMGEYAGEGENRRFEFDGSDFEPGDEDTSRRVGREISRYIIKHPPRSKGPKSLESYLNGMKASVGFYLQGLAAQDESDFFSTDNFADFFRAEPSGTFSFDLNQVRVGRIKNGNPITLNYVGVDGVESSEVKLATIQKEFPVLARILKTAALANQGR